LPAALPCSSCSLFKEKDSLFLSAFARLCVSRACLGKTITCLHCESGQKRRSFSYLVLARLHFISCILVIPSGGGGGGGGSFSSAFPMFVPSLSWLNTHFEYKNFIISRISVIPSGMSGSGASMCSCSSWRSRSCKKTPLLSPLFLCLSRACLGRRMIIFSSMKMASSQKQTGRGAGGVFLPLPALVAARKRAFFEFSLCLSRACLGQIIFFSIKTAKK
jgi:hypothetical protein